jgi:DNA repair protein RAD16
LNDNFESMVELILQKKTEPVKSDLDLDYENDEEEEDKFLGAKKFFNLEEAKLSSKLQHLVGQLKELKPGDKAIVYSQFTSCLTLIGLSLDQQKIKFERLDGTMSQSKRAGSIHNFKTSTEVNIFLISLKAGGVGLNLTEANKLWLVDPWFNPAIDRQAIERVYRLGQKRNVQVFRLVMKDSIEEKILELQKKKEALSEGVLNFDINKLSKLTKKDVEMLLS